MPKRCGLTEEQQAALYKLATVSRDGPSMVPGVSGRTLVTLGNRKLARPTPGKGWTITREGADVLAEICRRPVEDEEAA